MPPGTQRYGGWTPGPRAPEYQGWDTIWQILQHAVMAEGEGTDEVREMAVGGKRGDCRQEMVCEAKAAVTASDHAAVLLSVWTVPRLRKAARLRSAGHRA